MFQLFWILIWAFRFLNFCCIFLRTYFKMFTFSSFIFILRFKNIIEICYTIRQIEMVNIVVPFLFSNYVFKKYFLRFSFTFQTTSDKILTIFLSDPIHPMFSKRFLKRSCKCPESAQNWEFSRISLQWYQQKVRFLKFFNDFWNPTLKLRNQRNFISQSVYFFIYFLKTNMCR